MATLSHHQRPTVHQSASPSDTLDQDTNTRALSPSSTITPRSSPPLQPPPAPPADATTTGSGSGLGSGSGTNAPVYVPYRPEPGHSHHRTTSSVSRLNNRSSSSLFALAASAFDRTQNAIAAISEPSIRPRQSSGALSKCLSLAGNLGSIRKIRLLRCQRPRARS